MVGEVVDQPTSDRRLLRQQAAAIRALPALGGSGHCREQHQRSSRVFLTAATGDAPTSVQQQHPRGWQFDAVRLHHGDVMAVGRRRRQPPDAASGRTCQAVVLLPCAAADVAVLLPPSLALAATPHGHLDCRLQLLGFVADWPPARPASSTPGAVPRVLPARSAAGGYAVRTGALLAAHVLFPDHTRGLLGALSLPLAIADGAAAAAAVVPPRARAAIARRGAAAKARMQGDTVQHGRLGWLDAAAGCAAGGLHALRSASGPAAALATGGWLWALAHPHSAALCRCMIALLAVSADYERLGRDSAAGRLGTGKHLDAAWHACHKAAARRLAGFCNDLPARPPLAPLIGVARRCSIAAGVAVGGQALLGAAAAAGGMDGAVMADSAQDIQINHTTPRLLITASMRWAIGGDAAENHEASTGLSRAQLLELFTGHSSGCMHRNGVCGLGRTGHLEDSSGAAESSGMEQQQQQQQDRLFKRSRSCRCAGDGSNCLEAAAGRPVCDTIAAAAAAAAEGEEEDSGTPAAATTGLASIVVTDAVVGSTAAVAEQQKQQPLTCSRTASLCPHTGKEGAVGSAADGQQQPDPLAFLSALPLYGRADHASSHGASSLALHGGALESMELIVRAVYLALVFAPFLLAGLPMLAASWWLLTRAATQRQAHGRNRDSGRSGDASTCTLVTATADVEAQSDTVTLKPQHTRHVVLGLARRGAALAAALAALLDVLMVLLLGGHWPGGVSAWEASGLWLRSRAWVLLLQGCSWSGAACIKWAQWASARPDIFPQDFCDTLSQLHDRAPLHSFQHTRRTVEASLGAPLEEVFESFERTPLASGSIAQVHRAVLRQVGSSSSSCGSGKVGRCSCNTAARWAGCDVVVKVRHPGVARHIRLDFQLLTAAARAVARLPALQGLSVQESVSQFSHTMTAQTDLRVEAVHALRFANNFASTRGAVAVPLPVPGLVSEAVLVESYERGRSVAEFMRVPSVLNTAIVGLGVDAFLKMLLLDNFVHTDLHPGNIMFRELIPTAAAARTAAGAAARAAAGVRLLPQHSPADCDASRHVTLGKAAPSQPHIPRQPSLEGWEAELLHMSKQQQQRWNSQHGAVPQPLKQQDVHSAVPGQELSCSEAQPQLVLLDFGLAEQLTPAVRHHFISFLLAIAAGNGAAAGRHLLCWSHRQSCPDPAAFRRAVCELFDAACNVHAPAGINLDAVMKAVMGLARRYSVSIDSEYASLVISVCVLVGFASALDPGVNLMDAAIPTLLAYSATGLVMGRLYAAPASIQPALVPQ